MTKRTDEREQMRDEMSDGGKSKNACPETDRKERTKDEATLMLMDYVGYW